MKTLTFWFDPLSPYAHLAFAQLPQALQDHSVLVRYRPVLLAGLLKHHGQLGPAEIDGKREWTYRQVVWLARQAGVRLELPALHPFNPLPLLRLALACGADGDVSRWVAEQVLRHVWEGGADASDAQRLADLRARLQPVRDPDAPEVKVQLRANTQAALAAGAFGVPSVCVDDKLFWGADALPMLRAYLAGDPWFDTGWTQAGAQPGDPGLRRRSPGAQLQA